MPAWCSKCGALIAEGNPECPRCGHKVTQIGNEISPREIRILIRETIKTILLPLGLALLIGAGCLFIFLFTVK